VKNLQRCSANRLNKFLECPFKLALYNFGVEGRPTDDKFLKCGQAIHAWIEESIKCKYPITPEDYFCLYEVPEELRDRFDKCVSTVDAKGILGWKGQVEAEKIMQIYFEDGGYIELEARADFINDKDVGYDWKTGKELNKSEYVLQAQLYCYVFALPKVIFISLLTGEELEIKAPPEGYIKKIIKKYMNAVKEGNLPRKAKFDEQCQKWCEYYEICREVEE